jgi:hypothetical protein
MRNQKEDDIENSKFKEDHYKVLKCEVRFNWKDIKYP